MGYPSRQEGFGRPARCVGIQRDRPCGEAASLLVRLAESKLNKSQVVAAARLGGLNPKTELQACLTQLQDRRVIDVAADVSVSVIGVTGRCSWSHLGPFRRERIPTVRAGIDRPGGAGIVRPRRHEGCFRVHRAVPISSPRAIPLSGNLGRTPMPHSHLLEGG